MVPASHRSSKLACPPFRWQGWFACVSLAFDIFGCLPACVDTVASLFFQSSLPFCVNYAFDTRDAGRITDVSRCEFYLLWSRSCISWIVISNSRSSEVLYFFITRSTNSLVALTSHMLSFRLRWCCHVSRNSTVHSPTCSFLATFFFFLSFFFLSRAASYASVVLY